MIERVINELFQAIATGDRQSAIEFTRLLLNELEAGTRMPTVATVQADMDQKTSDPTLN